jgi:hypothetical protein
MEDFLDEFDLTDDQKQVIVHEAGHATMAIILDAVPVEVDLTGGDFWDAVAIPEFKGFALTEDKNRIKVLMAGPLAERKFRQIAKDRGALDKSMIQNILISNNITQAERKIEEVVIRSIENKWQSVISISKKIAERYSRGKLLTLTADLEAAFRLQNE